MAAPEPPRPGRGIEELGRRFALAPEAVGSLRRLLEVVVADPRAPTSVRDPAGVLKLHLADSLVALELPPLQRADGRLVDIGAGAGFPGLPLAAALPGWEVVLLESSARRCEFIRQAAARAELANVVVACGRAEEWTEARGSFDLATVRAVARLEVVLEYAAPLLRQSGHLVAWRGQRDRADELRAAGAAAELGMELGEVRQVRPFLGAKHRHLHIATKIGPTPERFPRRPGVALRRPLGGVDRARQRGVI